MLSPSYGGTIFLSARCTAARVHSKRPRAVAFVVAAILLLIAFLEGRAALAQIYSDSQHSLGAQQQAPQRQQPLREKRKEGKLPVLGGYPGTALAESQAAPAQPSRASRARGSQRSEPAPQQKQQQLLEKKHNEGALLLLGGCPDTTYFNLAHDIVAVLGRSAHLRVIAVDAPGGMESLRDLLLLRGVI